MIGKKIGPYSVVGELGAGGMGEVYRARDSRLNRDVALKVLPAAVAGDPERMARFEREAQLLASLNHPNIAAIYGLEESEGVRCLVLELVEGPTLAERLAQGAVPLAEALPIARQVAEAVEGAHEKGIVHRDLKPGNIKVTPKGTVKVLDFGLAKAFAGDAAETDISKSPTLTVAATQAGVILGTAAYMSPEQAKGKAVDRRADIWAWGIVLFEMLSGKPAFHGETVSETLAAVMMREVDWSQLPEDVPAPIVKLLRRCLEKDLRRRLQAIGEARLALEDHLANPAASSVVMAAPAGLTPAPAARRLLPWALAGVLLLALATVSVASWWRAERPAETSVVRFSLPFQLGQGTAANEQSPLAIAPDGSHIAYVGNAGETTQIFVRSLDQLEATPLAGTEGALSPFFSPDGKWIGFYADSKLKKIQVNGGAAFALADATVQPRGASWGPGDTIVFSPSTTDALKAVSGSGGAVREVTQLDGAKQERTHRWPQVLPDGEHALFTVGLLDSPEFYDDSDIDVVSLKTGERKTVLHGGSMARYVPGGHLVYARGGTLWAVPFDLGELQTTGTPVPVVQDVVSFVASGAAYFSVADDGTLVYVPGAVSSSNNQVAWADRSGKLEVLPLPAGSYVEPRLSPDGQHLALVVGGGRTTDIWVYDIARNTFSRLTFDGNNRAPVWTPDGKSVAYWSQQGPGRAGVYVKPADGSGEARLLVASKDQVYADSFSPDGKLLVLDRSATATSADLWVVSVGGDHKETPFVQSKFEEWEGMFSPDGRWIAYTSNESGRYEIYVRPFPGPGGKWQISTDGGMDPMWSADGRELFYNWDGKMMAVKVESRPSFKAGTPQVLYSGFFNPRTGDQAYGVAPDGKHFLVLHPETTATGMAQINVVLNWFSELRKLNAANKD